MAKWQDYPPPGDGRKHTVTGTVKRLQALHSPELDNERDVLVYLPPSYASSDRRYPVLYMHDGQNLFDEATSFAGEWRVDETLEAAGAGGPEAIVVGVANAGPARCDEYSPFEDARHGGGKGDLYLRFLAETLKPIVDADFRTLGDPAHTGIAGSSMGGLISLYGVLARPDVFGLAGVMSPSLWFAGGAVFPWIKWDARPGGRIYLDIGTGEGRRHVGNVRRLCSQLERKGWVLGRDLFCVVEPDAEHREAAWARRLLRALRFLLPAERDLARRAASG